ncbi:DinB family protein [Roseivirga sp. E12]|uniref:DinB family protein n=1 Tax=Roseivirga sp. E12 TaxID=2819237 RepID=UPI001ABC35FC|nr:DinB family protein [Roseivirga sp. E12]MBO3696930.1 DinB family protein [Roseivirga sp. E12]
MIQKPAPSEYNPFYEPYVSKLPEEDVYRVLEGQLTSIADFFGSIAEDKVDHRYAPGKWSIKEVLNHLNDAERVFSYRALSIVRGDTVELPGMDQDVYQENSRMNARTMSSLVDEFRAIRTATLALLQSVTEEDTLKEGIASGSKVTVRALAALIAGHYAHHVMIVKEKYL